MEDLKISIIISTYNSEDWLEKVLCGYSEQTFKKFEIVIADDGSTDATKKLIDNFREIFPFQIKHIWHKDDGFQKTKILNKAIMQCQSPYIIMTDGDCIPKNDFVEVHNNHKMEDCFLSGGYFKLPLHISKLISKDDIISNRCFDVKWLKKNGLKPSFKNNKLNSKGLKSKVLNSITTTKATWNGHNSSGWKKDLIEVNGFDERMQYGGEDRELGERLINSGIKSKQIRYNAIVLHLDHPRGYVNKESWTLNNNIRHKTRDEKIIRTPFGIEKL